MKKFLFCTALLSVLLLGATAMADGNYRSDTNSVTITDPQSTTVLIAKKTGTTMKKEDIVYVKQNDSGFSATTEFFLRQSPDAGFYTIMLGNSSGTPKSADFVIGDASDVFTVAGNLTELPNSAVDNGDTVTKSFFSGDLSISDIKTIVVTCDGKSVYSSVNAATELSGDSTAKVGVKISGLSKTSNVSVYISSVSIPSSGIITQ